MMIRHAVTLLAFLFIHLTSYAQQNIYIYGHESSKTLLELANKGNPAAQFELGFRYQFESIDPDSRKQSLFWLTKSANQGYKYAQALLGAIYLEGYGVKKDETKAAYWLEKAAEQGHAPSQATLASLYLSGKGVSKSIEKYAFWKNKFTQQGGYSSDKSFHDYSSFVGDGLPKDSSRHYAWLRRSAEEGYQFAFSQLGLSYALGSGVKKDNIQAYRWFYTDYIYQKNPEKKAAIKMFLDSLEKEMSKKDLEIAKLAVKKF